MNTTNNNSPNNKFIQSLHINNFCICKEPFETIGIKSQINLNIPFDITDIIENKYYQIYNNQASNIEYIINKIEIILFEYKSNLITLHLNIKYSEISFYNNTLSYLVESIFNRNELCITKTVDVEPIDIFETSAENICQKLIETIDVKININDRFSCKFNYLNLLNKLFKIDIVDIQLLEDLENLQLNSSAYK